MKKSSPLHIKKWHSECAVGESWSYYYRRDEKGRILEANDRDYSEMIYEYIDFKDGYLKKIHHRDKSLYSVLLYHKVDTNNQSIETHGNKTLIQSYKSSNKQLLKQIQLVDKYCVIEPHTYTFDFFL